MTLYCEAFVGLWCNGLHFSLSKRRNGAPRWPHYLSDELLI